MGAHDLTLIAVLYMCMLFFCNALFIRCSLYGDSFFVHLIGAVWFFILGTSVHDSGRNGSLRNSLNVYSRDL